MSKHPRHTEGNLLRQKLSNTWSKNIPIRRREMETAFFELLGQVGATVVTVAFSLFIAYLLYLKEQRDRLGNQIFQKKRGIYSVFTLLLETPIPGVSPSLTSEGPTKEQRARALSITEWAAGVSWEMRMETEGINVRDVWDRVRESLELLVQGILPNSALPALEVDSEEFRKWARKFVENTEHIRWFTHLYAGHSWARSLIGYMRDWERNHPNPVLRSQDVALLLDRVMLLRRLVFDDLLLESDYLSLKIEHAIRDYKKIIAGFVIMGVSSIIMPLVILVFPTSDNSYVMHLGETILSINVQYISTILLAVFVASTIAVMWLIVRRAKE